MPAPILIFGYGNSSRGDDGLGPAFLQAWAASPHFDPARQELLTDFQLQVEHALDLQNREWVCFVDASVEAPAPFHFEVLDPRRDDSFTTHAMSPQALLAVYQQVLRQTPPPCFLLSIRGYDFALGADLSESARGHLRQALLFIENLLTQTVEVSE